MKSCVRVKQRKGKRGNKVALNTWINTAQDQQLCDIVEATGKEKHLIVAEALQLLFGVYHKAGVI